MKHGLPVVAIVGRPNTGKSSLFNLMLGERKSIVDEMEGVTRDINIGIVRSHWGAFCLFDTAGYLEHGDEFNDLVQQKVKQAIEDTELILFVVDGRDENPVDSELALFLKRQNRRVIVIANKLDNRDMETFSNQFYSLGFPEIIPFSVMHKRGLVTLQDRIQDELEACQAQTALSENEVCIAIVGKPNVGKSHLVNTILGYDRSIVSDVAGTTRDSIDDTFTYGEHTIRLIDTAGLRRPNRIEGDIEYYSNVRTVQALERSHVVILLLNASESLSAQDKRIAEMVIEKGRALIVAYNKWDLVKPDGDLNHEMMEDHRQKILDALPEFSYVPVEFVSAKDNYRVKRLLDTAVKVFHDYVYRVPTAALNDWLVKDVKESYQRKQTSNLRVYYATQINSAPPRFMFFVNKKDFIRKDYPRFIENKLRLAFEFTGVPIKIAFREKNEQGDK